MKTQRYFYFFLWDSELVLIFVVLYNTQADKTRRIYFFSEKEYIRHQANYKTRLGLTLRRYGVIIYYAIK